MIKRIITPSVAVAVVAAVGFAAPATGSVSAAKAATPKHGSWIGVVKNTFEDIDFSVDKSGKHVKHFTGNFVTAYDCSTGAEQTAAVKRVRIKHGRFAADSSDKYLFNGVSVRVTGHFTSAKKMTGTLKVDAKHGTHCDETFRYTATHQRGGLTPP